MQLLSFQTERIVDDRSEIAKKIVKVTVPTFRPHSRNQMKMRK